MKSGGINYTRVNMRKENLKRRKILRKAQKKVQDIALHLNLLRTLLNLNFSIH